MLILCLSDIHGNLDALRAVLATAERHAVHKLLVAGDIVYPGTEPAETLRRLFAAGAIMVQGVADRAVATVDPEELAARSEHEREMVERLRATQLSLGDLALAKLRRLPAMQRLTLEDGRELVLVHGSPADPSEPLTFDMSDDEIMELLGDDPGDVVVCGMSHVPFDRVVGDVRVINVGSVGEAPSGRHADATWIESSVSGITVEQVAIPLP